MRRSALVAAIALTVAVAAALANPGEAAAARPGFQSKGGKIVCEVVNVGGPALRCQYRPDELMAILIPGARPSADYATLKLPAGRRVLPRGAVWRRGSFACQMGVGRVRCWTRGTSDDWQFTLSRRFTRKRI